MQKRKNKLLISFITSLYVIFTLTEPGFSAEIIYDLPKDKNSWTKPLKKCWSYELTNISDRRLASDNDFIFMPLLSGRVLGISSKNGKLIWSADVGGDIIANLLHIEKNVYVLSREKAEKQFINGNQPQNQDYSLSSINTDSGIVNWKRQFNGSKIDAVILAVDKKILLSTVEGKLIFINPESGKTLSEYKSFRNQTSVFLSQEKFIVWTSGKKISIFSESNMNDLSELTVQEKPRKVYFYDLNKLFWEGSKNNLKASDLSNGKLLWTRRFGAGISGIEKIDGYLFVASIDNFVYLLDAKDGGIVWKRRFTNRVYEKALILGDIAVITAFGENTANFINIKTGKVINIITLSDANNFVGSPFYIGGMLVFPTVYGLYSYKDECTKE